MQSIIKEGGIVSFPKFTGERIYMIPFTKSEGLPQEYSRWSSLVSALVEDIETDGVIYFMADQGAVKAGNTHRRGGAHIDGNYGYYNGVVGFQGDSRPGFKMDMDYRMPMDTKGGIVLASSHVGCKAYEGDFNDSPAFGGDCAHIDVSSAKQSVLQPHRVYIGNISMVHETTPAQEDQNRTVVRLILPDDYEFAA